MVPERGGDPVDRGGGRAQLVRCDRDEVQLELVEPDELVVHLRLLDRDRRARGDELEQLLVVEVEVARLERADVEHADHAAGLDQRHAEHALDALLAQDRVEHVGMVDVVEHDRLGLGGDASGEAAPDRDAHALLDLLLEPDGSAGDELVRLPVEHQHGGGVDLEHVPEPNQQLTHQLVETETDERRLQHALHLLEPRSATALGLEQPSVLDRETHAVGDELEQFDVVLREDPRCQRTDVEHSEHVVREDQRHSGHALDALLAQDRVQHVGVVDVVEHDRSPFGGDPAREAAADRDPHALLDLFLEPDRRPRDELVSEVVPEKNCGRVGVEHVPDSREELAQELVQVQVRQRRIGDELESAGDARRHRSCP